MSIAKLSTPLRIPEKSRPMRPRAYVPGRIVGQKGSAQRHFRADALIREQFKQNRMPPLAIDDLDLFDAALQSFDSALDLGYHAARNPL
jgi:hypothetical protein